MDAYLWLKALHIAAVITWIGGTLTSALMVSFFLEPGGPNPRIAAMIRWDRVVTSPAMGVAWALGLTVAAWGGWFSSPWLHLKLVLAVILSGLHGVLSGTLRRNGQAATPASAIHRLAAPTVLITASVIAILVVVKPF